MKYSYHIATSILAIASSVTAQRRGGGPHGGHSFQPPGGIPGQGPSTITSTNADTTSATTLASASTDTTTSPLNSLQSTESQSTSTLSASAQSSTALSTGNGGGGSTTGQSPTTTAAPSGTNGGGAGGGVMTISVTNSYSVALSLDFASNAGAPAPIGNPTATTIGQAATTAYSYPTGWAGRIYVGKTLNSANSKIEGSVTGPPDMDASYVDGYSVPIICTSAGSTSGCTIELFGDNGNYCNQTDHSLSDFTICLNPKVDNDDGTADPFFAPCAGQAYTFPSDNGANKANVGSTVNCCIGTACGGGSSKRDLKAHKHGRHEKRSNRPGLHVRQEHWSSNPRSHVHQLVRDAKLRR